MTVEPPDSQQTPTLPQQPETPQSSSGWKRRLRFITGIPTPVIFLGSITIAIIVLWWQGEMQRLIDNVSNASPLLMAITIPFYVSTVWLICYRWHVLVRMAQGSSNLPRAAEAFLTSVVINYAAPVGLAVPSRAALTKRALGLDARSTGTIALWEILTDVIVLGTGSIIWLLLSRNALGPVGDELAASGPQYALAALVACALLGMLALIFLRDQVRRQRVLSASRRIILAPRERPREAALALGMALLYWISQGIVLALLIEAMGVSTSIGLVLGITSLPLLVGMLSPIPGGAVVREAMMFIVARMSDVPGSPIIAAAVIYRLALFIAVPILYLLVRAWISRHPVYTPPREASSTSKSQTTSSPS